MIPHHGVDEVVLVADPGLEVVEVPDQFREDAGDGVGIQRHLVVPGAEQAGQSARIRPFVVTLFFAGDVRYVLAAGERVVSGQPPRGEITDRNGVPLAESLDGMMIVADPTKTRKDAAAIASILETCAWAHGVSRVSIWRYDADQSGQTHTPALSR